MPIDSFPSVTDQVARQAYLAVVTYQGGTWVDTTSVTFADVDATNLVVTFTAPPSGRVIVELEALAKCSTNATNFLSWNVRQGTTDLTFGGTPVISAPSCSIGNWERRAGSMLVTGLVPGTVCTWKWTHSVQNAIQMSTYSGSLNYPSIMRVLDAGVNTSGVMSGGIWSGPQIINTGDPATLGLAIRAAGSQTANLQEWQNSAGAAVLSVDPTGQLNALGLSAWNMTTGYIGVQSLFGADGIAIIAKRGNDSTLVADIQQWQKADNTVLARITNNGTFVGPIGFASIFKMGVD
jgi:hypothetical protein